MPTADFFTTRPQRILESLCEYVDAHRPSWSSGLIGASEEEIDRLADAYYPCPPLGPRTTEMPAEYRRWLTLAGRDDNGLISKIRQASVDIDELLAHHGDLVRSWPTHIDRRYPIAMLLHYGNPIAFDLTSRGPELWEVAEGQPLGFYGESWAHILFQSAIRTCLPPAPRGRVYHSASANSAKLAATRQGFPGSHAMVRHIIEQHAGCISWFSDRRTVHATFADIQILAQLDRHDSIALLLVGDDGPAIHALGDEIAATLGAVPVKHAEWR